MVAIFYAIIISLITAYIAYEYFLIYRQKKQGRIVTKKELNTVENYLNVS